MENTALPSAPADEPKTYTVSCSFSLSGAGLPSRARVFEFVKSMERRDLAIMGGALALVLVLEPIFFYVLFSLRLSSKLEANNAHMISEVSTQVRADFLSAIRENFIRQSTEPLKPVVEDPTNLVVPPSQEKSEFQKGGPILQSPAPTPPKPGR